MGHPPDLAAHKPHFHRNEAWKQPVRCATTAAGTLATSFENGDSAGGVTLATGDRILIKDQAAPAENGIYRVNASGAPTRDYDMDVAAEVPGALALVLAGTLAGKMYRCTNATVPTLGSTAIDWALAGIFALDDLTDVDAAAPDDGDVLTWDDGTSTWIAAPAAGGGDTTGQTGACFDGGLSVLVAPKYQDVVVPYTGTLTGWRVYAQQTGDITFGVAKCTNAAFPTFTSIVGVASPSLSSADHAVSSGMTGWTTAVTAGDIVRFTLSTVSTIRAVVVVLDYSRP